MAINECTAQGIIKPPLQPEGKEAASSQKFVLHHQCYVAGVEQLEQEGHQELREELGHRLLVGMDRQQCAQGLGCLQGKGRESRLSCLPLSPVSASDGGSEGLCTLPPPPPRKPEACMCVPSSNSS